MRQLISQIVAVPLDEHDSHREMQIFAKELL